MKYRIEITNTAKDDLRAIWEYIAQDNIIHANTFISRLTQSIAKLQRLPERCPKIPEGNILGGEYRHLILGKYRIIFRIQGKIIYILRIMHGARLLDLQWLEKFFESIASH